MNFLAHLHLAHLARSSLLGNLLADFVRGNPCVQWPQPVAEGIMMHRRLDAMTDALPEVKEARLLFRAATRRVAPITLDVLWDHFLARHWQTLVPEMALADFSRLAEQAITPQVANTPEAFQSLNAVMWQERWLEHYADAARIERVLARMAARRPRLAALSDSYQDFVVHYPQLEALFFRFYPRLMAMAQAKTL